MSTYKYFRIYENLGAATHDDTIVSPNVSLIEDGSKILHFDTHVRNEELLVIGKELAEARMVKKYIADEKSNRDLIELAKCFGWIAPDVSKIRVTDAMMVSTVNDKNGYSLLSDSKLTSFDEFEYFTGVTVCPGYNTDSDIPSLPSTCTSIKLPESIERIGDYAFRGCSGLSSVTIPNSVISIERLAFYDCRGLTSVTIPNSVTSIGSSAFKNCSSLTSVTIGNSVTSIGMGAFENCTSLTSVTIPNSVTSIGESAFYYCSGLTSVTIGNSVTSIGDEVFSGCSGLTSVTIPHSVTSIGSAAFFDCGCLSSVSIPNRVTSIGSSAFSSCSGLTSVTIPHSVTSIGDEAFYGCDGLTSVIFTGTSTQWRAIQRGTNWHYNVPTTTVYCEGDDAPMSLDAV